MQQTEYGDMLPLAGVPYRVGNNTSTNINPNACLQDITYAAVIRYDTSDPPTDLQFSSAPSNYQSGNFSWILTKNGNDIGDGLPENFVSYVAYRGLPDSLSSHSFNLDWNTLTKTAVNSINDYAYNTNAITNINLRQQVHCLAKLKTIQNLYYIQNTMDYHQWHVAQEEGFNTNYNKNNHCDNIDNSLIAIEQYMPVIPYIRESRRLIGMYTLTGNDIYRIGTHPPVAAQKSFVDSIAIGDYMTDFHQCNNNNDFELDIENQNDISKISGPFQIPLQVFIPETLDGFLAAEKNISQSRIASAATRLQPITMLTGQAVGALAGLAVAQQQLPRYVRPENVQVVLANANARLNFFEFTDVPRGDPDWAAIQLIAVRKILVGTNSQTNYYAENRFNPNNTVSYSDAANALVSIGQMIVAPNQTALQTLAHAGIVFQGCAVPGTACLTSPVVPSDFSSALHATMALNPNNIVVSLSASSHATYTRRDFAILMMQVFKNLR